MSTTTVNLESHLIPHLPSSIYYIPSFLTPTEEEQTLQQIPSNKWITLSNRRLQPHPAPLTKSNTLISATPLPKFLLEPCVRRIEELGIFKDAPHAGINHCLINEYIPGQGIMPHEDGEAYFPVVATVSLGAGIVLDIREKRKEEGETGEKRSWRIFQERGSLLVTMGEAYRELLHGIAEVEVDEGLDGERVVDWGLLSEEGRREIEDGGARNVRGERVSLTFRDVRKVSKIGGKIFGKTRG